MKQGKGPIKGLLILTLIIALLAMTLPLLPTAKAATTITDSDLAAHWAPVWYQDTDSTNYRADYITNFDFDNDWVATNNWENLEKRENNEWKYPLKANIYYWVVETETHWFIGYADFHPRDWSDWNPLDEHENDMEGLLLVIKKDGSTYGQFMLMITVAHLDFYSYKDYDASPSSAVATGQEDIDGDVQFMGSHPYVYVEAKGHGVYGDKRWEEGGFPDEDGIIYRYTGTAEEPTESDNWEGSVGYDLKNMNELWERRDPESYPNTFYEFGIFRGDTYGENAANAPWGWDDRNDDEVYEPDFFIDPAYLVDYYHDGLGDFSHTYVYRSYAETVTFPDANLEAAIREALGKPTGDITAAELATLTTLDASDRGITDLTGIEYCVNLTWLRLWANQISDLSPLAYLTNLLGLDLWGNQISDLSPLAYLTNLLGLSLGENQISDLSPLSPLANLLALDLRENQISDISPLSSLTNLAGLALRYNQISDLSPLVENSGLGEGDVVKLQNNNLDLWEGSADLENIRALEDRGVTVNHDPIGDLPTVTFPDESLEAAIRDALNKPTGDITAAGLAGLTTLDASGRSIADLTGIEYCVNLTWLDLEDNQITDISSLSSLTNLTSLRLWENQISDLSPLSSLTNLTQLYLWDNQISDLSPLASLTNLTRLSLGGNQISDISPLSSLTSLTWLYLFDNQISDLSPLSSLTNLTWLGLWENQISDLSPLASLTSLTLLNLWWNQISDLSPLSSLTSLNELYLGSNQISDISLLASLTNLTRLGLGFNQIIDITPLANLTSLTYLSLWWNQISDISLLASLTNLTELRLQGNQISDLSPLASLTSLTELWLGGNRINDVSPLADLTSLTWLWLGDNQISDITPLTSLSNLTYLSLGDALRGGNQINDISPLVENSGLGEGDEIWLENNNLKLWEGSADLENIRALEDRGVTVSHDPILSVLVADVNNDGVIGIPDLALVAGSFSSAAPGAAADINNDDIVDIFDLVFIGVNYRKTESP